MRFEDQIKKYFAFRFHGRRIVWTKYFKIYYDGGSSIFEWFPRIRKQSFDPFWNLFGFAIYWFGREFNFVFGKDVNNFFEER